MAVGERGEGEEGRKGVPKGERRITEVEGGTNRCGGIGDV